MSSTKLTSIDKRGLVKSFIPEEKVLVRGNLSGSALIFPNNTVTPFHSVLSLTWRTFNGALKFVARFLLKFSRQKLMVIGRVSSALHLVVRIWELEIEHLVYGLLQEPLNSRGSTQRIVRATGVKLKIS